MKRIIIVVAAFVLTCLLFSQDIIHLYKQHLENPIAIPLNEIDSISHNDAGVQKIFTKDKTIETQISDIDSLVFASIHLSDDTIDMFVNSTACVIIESGDRDYELENEHPDIIDAELIFADRDNNPDAKDEILIFGFSEGTAEIRVLKTKNNQTAKLVVNVKTPTDNDVAVTKQYSESVRDYINQQGEMPVEDFQNMVISWLDTQNYVKKTVLSPNRDLITITFNNGAIFRIDFQDMSFFDSDDSSFYAQSFAPCEAMTSDSSYIDVSEREDEIIIENGNVLFIQARSLPLSNASLEWSHFIDAAFYKSPVLINYKQSFQSMSFLDEDFSKYGIIIISQTHGGGNWKGAFQVETNDWETWLSKNLNIGISYYINDGRIHIDKDEPLICWVEPQAFNNKKVKNNSILYANYCWSFGISHKNYTFGRNDSHVVGYKNKSNYFSNEWGLRRFYTSLLKGDTFRNAFSYDRDGGLHILDKPSTNKDSSELRFFSISIEDVTEFSYKVNPIIKGKINGFKNLKSWLKYYVYVFDNEEELKPADITTKGKLIEINRRDGTFKYEYPDLPVNILQKKYKVAIGFKDLGVTYYSIKDLIFGLCPDDHHPHMIDLGLPSGTKWACCNVDDHSSNQSPTNYGSYYAWGETKEKDVYNFYNYKYCTNDSNEVNVYSEIYYLDEDGQRRYVIDIGEDIAGTKYDVAHMKWGGSWRMPSLSQIKELKDNNCFVVSSVLNGVYGTFIFGQNNAIIFIPEAGERINDFLLSGGGVLWSSSLSQVDHWDAHRLITEYDLIKTSLPSWRTNGHSVRPVSP